MAKSRRAAVRGGPGPTRIVSRVAPIERLPEPDLEWWGRPGGIHSRKRKFGLAGQGKGSRGDFSDVLSSGVLFDVILGVQDGVGALAGSSAIVAAGERFNQTIRDGVSAFDGSSSMAATASHGVIAFSNVGTPVDASGSTAITPTIPGASNAATLLMAFVFSRVSNITYSVSGGGVWSLLQENTGASGPTISIWTAAGTEATAPTFTPNLSANVSAGLVCRLTNINLTNPVDASGTFFNGGGSTQDIGPILPPTMGVTDGLLVALGAMRSGDATSAVTQTADGLTWTQQKFYATLTGSDLTFNIQTAPFTGGPVGLNDLTLDLNGTAAVGASGRQIILRAA